MILKKENEMKKLASTAFLGAILLSFISIFTSAPALAAGGARDANVVCSAGASLAQARNGINLSVRSYAKAGYKISSPTIRTDHLKHYLICVTTAKN
jgi:hypothetical protein